MRERYVTDEPAKRRPLNRRIAAIVSPLRYPGAKRRFAGYIAETIRLNDLEPRLFVEPFAGGASVALQLLADGVVPKIALGERDPLLADFWWVAFNDSNWLIKQVQSIDVTLSTWKRLRKSTSRARRDRALACLFLNRTSFSGILSRTAGPIGGTDQKSQYKLGCRFNRETIVKRLRMVAELSDRVAFVNRGDYVDTVAKAKTAIRTTREAFFYFDPPFFAKAERLYRYFFANNDHEALRDFLFRLKSPWFLSYDASDAITKLYKGVLRPAHVDMLYSVAATQRNAREIVVTTLPRLPKETRLWRTQEEWRVRNVVRPHRLPHATNVSARLSEVQRYERIAR